ncbi:hypothetical protein J1614_006180 [Plenodomus biglobosus]|nr:hypothetical protein J1614_006180 [Plenodomus biglobosus]
MIEKARLPTTLPLAAYTDKFRVDPSPQAHCDKENNAPDLKEFGSYPHQRGSTCPNLNALSPCKSMSSRRRRLIGSLRRISSLRSIRTSPGKSKERDDSPPPPPEVPRVVSRKGSLPLTLLPQSPCTPTRYVRNSLALNFKESPPGQPMFDLSKPRRSISSSVIVRHSSPVTVPSSSREETRFSVSVGPPTLPAGTVPTTPGPFQKALDMEATKKTLSPVFSYELESGGFSEPISTPMPGTNLALEDIDADIVLGPSSPNPPHEPSSHFALPAHNDIENLVDFDESQYDCAAARRASAEVLKDLIHNLEPTTSEAPDARKQHTLRKKPTFSFQGADRIGLEPSVVASADDEGTEQVHLEGIEHIVWEDENTLRVKASPEVATGRSTEDNDMESYHRLQAWHNHTGLYDGSGYGGGETESTISHPSMSTYGTTETAPTSEDTASTAGAKCKSSVKFPTMKAMPSPGPSDHETLEQVIRAYAVYDEDDEDDVEEEEEEEASAPCTSASDLAEDLDLANRIGA